MLIITPHKVLSLREARSDISITGRGECPSVLKCLPNYLVAQRNRFTRAPVGYAEYPTLHRSVERFEMLARDIRDNYSRRFFLFLECDHRLSHCFVYRVQKFLVVCLDIRSAIRAVDYSPRIVRVIGAIIKVLT